MDMTAAQSVRSHFMDMHVLHNATAVPTTVIMLAAVDNRQRSNLRQCQQVIHHQRQEVIKTIHDGFFFVILSISLLPDLYITLL